MNFSLTGTVILKILNRNSKTMLAVKNLSERERKTGNSCNPTFITNHVEPQIKQIKKKRKILTAIFSKIFINSRGFNLKLH
jgi:hypothetical protein